MKNIAIITARSGSKRLPHKNIMPLAGKPLMAYSIEAALESGIFDTVMVSTDSEEYAKIAREWGAEVPFLRSAENSSDKAGSWEVMREVLDYYKSIGEEFDMFTLLQHTSPLRNAEDLKGAYQMYNEKNAKSIVSVCEAESKMATFNTIADDGSLYNWVNHGTSVYEKGKTVYRLNGSIYMVRVSTFPEDLNIYKDNCLAYVMPQERSMDIDTELDFVIAEAVLKHFSK